MSQEILNERKDPVSSICTSPYSLNMYEGDQDCLIRPSFSLDSCVQKSRVKARKCLSVTTLPDEVSVDTSNKMVRTVLNKKLDSTEIHKSALIISDIDSFCESEVFKLPIRSKFNLNEHSETIKRFLKILESRTTIVIMI